MEASGHSSWLERLMAELNIELWIGAAAEIRSQRVHKQKTDREDGRTADFAFAAGRSFSTDLGAELGKPDLSQVIGAAGGCSHPSYFSS
jgi:hypothetical protein